MASRLKVSTTELNDASNEYKKCNSEMMNICSQINSAVYNVNGSWRGKASDSFLGKFEEMYAQLKQTDDKTNDAVDELLKAAGIFESAENANAQMAAALHTGTSPFK